MGNAVNAAVRALWPSGDQGEAGENGKMLRSSSARPQPRNFSPSEQAQFDSDLKVFNDALAQYYENGGSFKNEAEAAKYLHDNLASLGENYDVEIWAGIYKNGSAYLVGRAKTDYMKNIVSTEPNRYAPGNLDRRHYVADYHTHGSYLFREFSPDDLNGSLIDHTNAYVSGGSRSLVKFDWKTQAKCSYVGNTYRAC